MVARMNGRFGSKSDVLKDCHTMADLRSMLICFKVDDQKELELVRRQVLAERTREFFGLAIAGFLNHKFKEKRESIWRNAGLSESVQHNALVRTVFFEKQILKDDKSEDSFANRLFAYVELVLAIMYGKKLAQLSEQERMCLDELIEFSTAAELILVGQLNSFNV